MTMFYNDEIDRIFKRMSASFSNMEDIFEEGKSGYTQTAGPIYYGYTLTVGPDGKPVVCEYGNAKPGLLPSSEIAFLLLMEELLVETFFQEKVGL